MRDAAAGVSLRARRQYDGYTIFDGFFFGQTSLDAELVQVHSSLVDCAVFQSSEREAVQAAKEAMTQFGKPVIVVCDHGCAVTPGMDPLPAGTEDALFGYLCSDLCGDTFKRIGRILAGRSGD